MEILTVRHTWAFYKRKKKLRPRDKSFLVKRFVLSKGDNVRFASEDFLHHMVTNIPYNFKYLANQSPKNRDRSVIPRSCIIASYMSTNRVLNLVKAGKVYTFT